MDNNQLLLTSILLTFIEGLETGDFKKAFDKPLFMDASNDFKNFQLSEGECTGSGADMVDNLYSFVNLVNGIGHEPAYDAPVRDMIQAWLKSHGPVRFHFDSGIVVKKSYDTLKYINDISEPTVMQSAFRQLGDAGYYIGTAYRRDVTAISCDCRKPACEPLYNYEPNSRMSEYMDEETAEITLERYRNGDDTFPIETRT